MADKKIYILDTNVLLHNPDALFSFEKSVVGIPGVVLEEIDAFKREGNERGRNARQVIRYLDALRKKGSLKDGVSLENGGMLRVLFLPTSETILLPFKIDKEDNAILLIAVSMQQHGYNVIFISKDLNARVKADSLGLTAQDYLKERVSKDDFYRGWTRVQVPAVELKREIPASVLALAKEDALQINQFILAESQHNPHNYVVFRFLGGTRFHAVSEPKFKWPLTARNPQQLMALDLLLDDSIQLVSLFGPAGTGKTFLALLAGLHKVLEEGSYEKILAARPIVPLGRDVGFLPGTLEEKLYTWMLPVYDNMDFIMHSAGMARHERDLEREQHDKYDKHQSRHDRHDKKRHHKGRRPRRGLSLSLESLINRGKISLEAITYMRGRSIPYQFIFIDEVQNLTPHEVKTLVSRVGEGSKIILAGDPYQIDEPYLDFSSNGLVLVGEKFKNQPIFGSVYLETSERSELSQLATELL